MARAAHRLDAWLLALGSASLIAWSVWWFYGSDLTLPAFCSAGTPWAESLSVSFNLALLFNSPSQIAAGWALMIAAMMSPLIVAPLRHVRDRSFATPRAPATLLFFAAYMAAWLGSGVALATTALDAPL